MWPFKRKPMLDPETAEWHLDNFEWLLESFAGRRRFLETKLVLPAPGFFKNDGEQGHARAQRLFEQVKAFCGISAYIELVADGSVPQQHGMPTIAEIHHGKHAAGLYSQGQGWGWNTARIHYASHLLADTQALIAVFAHELAHYLLDEGTPTPPPIEDDETEFLTDLTAVYLGFGVFLANSVFSFQQFNDGAASGWRSSRLGYLPERDLVFATAIYLAVREEDPASAVECLKPHLGKLLKEALRDLASYADRIAAMRERGKHVAFQAVVFS